MSDELPRELDQGAARSLPSATLLQNSCKRPVRRPMVGYALVIVAYALMVADLASLLIVAPFVSGWFFLAFPLCVYLVLYVYLGLLWIFQTGKRLLVRSAQETVAIDPRPYVLYLRAFTSDEAAGGIPEHASLHLLMEPEEDLGWNWKGPSWMNVQQALSLRLLFPPPLTEEEQIVRAFSDVGPVITVGAPYDSLPPLGASRLYIRDAEWRARVTQLIQNAGAVVIHVSDSYPNRVVYLPASLSPGLQWEIATVARAIPPDRLHFLIAADKDACRQFLSTISDTFPRGLPSTTEGPERAGRVRGIIAFDSHWEPRFFPFDVSPFRRRRYPVTSAIRDTLRSLRLGLEPPRFLPDSKSERESISSASRRWLTKFILIAAVIVIGTAANLIAILITVPVGASEVMVSVPPSNTFVPLTKAAVPVPPWGRAGSTRSFPVLVTINLRGAVYTVHVGQGAPVVNPFFEEGIGEDEYRRWIEEAVRTWRFKPIRRAGLPVPAKTSFVWRFLPGATSILGGNPLAASQVTASELMVMIPPSTVPVPLLKSRLPAPTQGLVQSEEAVTVAVSIGTNGAVLNVFTGGKNPALATFVQNTVKNWRFQPILRSGTPVLAEATFTYTLRPLPASPAPPTRVSASQLMVMIPPSTVPVPLLKAQVPIAPPGMVQSAEMVVVGVLIDTVGKVLNVSTSTKNRAVGAFVQNTVKTWRFQPVPGTRLRVRSVVAFTYPVRPLPANPARQPSSLPPSLP